MNPTAQKIFRENLDKNPSNPQNFASSYTCLHSVMKKNRWNILFHSCTFLFIIFQRIGFLKLDYVEAVLQD